MIQTASNRIPLRVGNAGHDTFHPRGRRPQQSAEMQPVAKHHTTSVSQDSLDPNSLTAKSESGMTCLQLCQNKILRIPKVIRAKGMELYWGEIGKSKQLISWFDSAVFALLCFMVQLKLETDNLESGETAHGNCMKPLRLPVAKLPTRNPNPFPKPVSQSRPCVTDVVFGIQRSLFQAP